ncbi:MAG: lysophospholipid acyltransferase family protein [Proteobacteria bacterium]|nr:lysophospholipid acyltransferase family protein [Pseudomonadota bacterium]
MPLMKRIVASAAFQSAAGSLAANYLRLVWKTSRLICDPPYMYEEVQMPAIIAFWHGQHFLAPFIKRNHDTHRTKVLISRHRDGEINARAAEKLGIETIRGSGAHNGEFHRKGGAAGFSAMLDALAEGYNVALTADVPKVSRVCGMGVIKLAQHSGRPIYPIALASSRRIELDNWDKSAINLPFSRVAFCGCGPFLVPRDADDATLEARRQEVEAALNDMTARAYAIVDGKAQIANTVRGDVAA